MVMAAATAILVELLLEEVLVVEMEQVLVIGEGVEVVDILLLSV